MYSIDVGGIVVDETMLNENEVKICYSAVVSILQP